MLFLRSPRTGAARPAPRAFRSFAAALFCAFAALVVAALPLSAQTLADALDAPEFTFTSQSSGGAGWAAQTATTHDGVDAARSGSIGHYGSSTLQVTFNGPATVRFYWKVSSEGGCDYLRFRVDGVEQGYGISGAVDWQFKSFTVSGSGSHTLTWTYSKDGSVVSGADAGWVDQLEIIGPAPAGPPVINNAYIVPAEGGAPAALVVSATGAVSYQWYRGASGDTGAPLAGANSASFLASASDADAAYWVRVTNSRGSADSATLTVPAVSAPEGRDLLGMGSLRFGQLGNGMGAGLPFPLTSPAGVKQVALGARHALFLDADGRLWAQGSSENGQLGSGSNDPSYEPLLVATGVAQIAAGAEHSLFIKTDGSLWAMGANASGQLGDGSADNRVSPVRIATGVAQVAAGSEHSLFLKKDGSLWAMGSNANGQLCLGSTLAYRRLPARVATGVVRIAAGDFHSLFIKTGGSLWGSGRNGSGQLNSLSTLDLYAPMMLAAGVAQVAAGENHTVFLKTDASLWGLGDNSSGQLGLGDEPGDGPPYQIATGVRQVAAASSHTLFIKTDGSLWGTGYNGAGQLGNGQANSAPRPLAVAADVAFVATGTQHTVFLKTDGSLWGAGGNDYGAPGLAKPTKSGTPLTLAHEVARIAAGRAHTLFLKTDGTLWALGDNSSGQLGDGTTVARALPVQIATGVAQISAGQDHSLFVKTDGTLWGMGENGSSQLGLAGPSDRLSPVQIATGVALADAGSVHSLFLKTDGSLWGMGSNSQGLLGLDSFVYIQTTPAQIATGVVSFAAGSAHTLFVKSDATLWGMGTNSSYQLGSNWAYSVYTPVQIAIDVLRADAGGDYSLFLKTDASLWGLGGNYYGQLGVQTYYYYSSGVPAQISASVLRFAAGGTHSLFVKADGSLHAAGANTDGQLGLGYGDTYPSAHYATRVTSPAYAVAAGAAHSLYLSTPTRSVTFDLGASGSRAGGGALVQRVARGGAAVPPLVSSSPGQVFLGWDAAFDSVDSDLVVHALYRAGQRIAFAPPAAFLFKAGQANALALSATAGSGLPVAFSVVSGPATLGDDGRTLAFSGPGLVVIGAAQAGDDTWAPAEPLTRRIFVNAAAGKAQTIDFTPPATLAYGDPALDLSANASSDLPVQIELVSGPATLEDGRVLLVERPGRVVLRASQPGGEGYAAAAPVTRVITVKKAVVEVSVQDASRYVGQANPEFVVLYSGFVDVDPGDAAAYLAAVAALDNPPRASTRANERSPQGDYPVAFSRGSDDLYEFRAAQPGGVLTVRGFGGAYEALLVDENGSFVGKITLQVPKDSLTYTGVIDLSFLPKPVPFNGAAGLSGTNPGLVVHTETEAAFATWNGWRDGLHSVEFRLDADGRFTGRYSLNGVTLAGFLYGERLNTFSAGQSSLWAGRHTLLLAPDTSNLSEDDFRVPRGFGHASVDVALATGRMSIRGKLADGTPLSASLPQNVLGAYLLWNKPYGSRPQSWLAGLLADDSLELPDYGYSQPDDLATGGVSGSFTGVSSGSGFVRITPTEMPSVGDSSLASFVAGSASISGTSSVDFSRSSLELVSLAASRPVRSAFAPRSLPPDENFSSALRSTGRDLYWQKAPLPESTPPARQDRSYPGGFASLTLHAYLLPWLPPVRGTDENAASLPQRLGISDDPTQGGVFAIGYGGFGQWLGYNLDDLPAAAALLPSGKVLPETAGLLAWRILALDPASGAFSGSLTLVDPAPPAGGSGAHATRTVPFSGTFVQEMGADESLLGAGFFLIPALPGSTYTEQFSAEIRFYRP